MFSQDRDSMRRYFLDAWRKASGGELLEPLESRIAQIIREHPEYQALLETPDAALARDFSRTGVRPTPFCTCPCTLPSTSRWVQTDLPVYAASTSGWCARRVTPTRRSTGSWSAWPAAYGNPNSRDCRRTSSPTWNAWNDWRAMAENDHPERNEPYPTKSLPHPRKKIP